MMVPALLVGTLTACTPGSQPVAALAMRDDRPLAILVTCGGDFAQISVYRNDETARPTPTGRVDTLVEWRVSGEPAGEVVEAPLFGTPPVGWQTGDPTSEPPEGQSARTVSLTELTPGVRYSLSGHSGRDSAPVHFTTDDLGRIGADDVLAPVSRRESEIMSRRTFERKAAESCDNS